MLHNDILLILENHKDGISEYQLLNELQNIEGFEKENFENSFTLFQTHFLLFHTLYKLQDYCYSSLHKKLSIHFLKIHLEDFNFESSSDALTEHDPLREYYLNVENLETTNEEDVEEMLNSFWKKFYSYNKISKALAILNLPESASESEIKSRFRELVLQHHPDRGGSAQEFNRIVQAMEFLKC